MMCLSACMQSRLMFLSLCKQSALTQSRTSVALFRRCEALLQIFCSWLREIFNISACSNIISYLKDSTQNWIDSLKKIGWKTRSILVLFSLFCFPACKWSSAFWYRVIWGYGYLGKRLLFWTCPLNILNMGTIKKKAFLICIYLFDWLIDLAKHSIQHLFPTLFVVFKNY